MAPRGCQQSEALSTWWMIAPEGGDIDPFIYCYSQSVNVLTNLNYMLLPHAITFSHTMLAVLMANAWWQ